MTSYTTTTEKPRLHQQIERVDPGEPAKFFRERGFWFPEEFGCEPDWCPYECVLHTPLHISDVRDDISKAITPDRPCTEFKVYGTVPHFGDEGVTFKGHEIQHECQNWMCPGHFKIRSQRYLHRLHRYFRAEDRIAVHDDVLPWQETATSYRNRTQERNKQASSRNLTKYVSIHTAFDTMKLYADEDMTASGSDLPPANVTWMSPTQAFADLRKTLVIGGLMIGHRTSRPVTTSKTWPLPTQHHDRQGSGSYVTTHYGDEDQRAKFDEALTDLLIPYEEWEKAGKGTVKRELISRWPRRVA